MPCVIIARLSTYPDIIEFVEGTAETLTALDRAKASEFVNSVYSNPDTQIHVTGSYRSTDELPSKNEDAYDPRLLGEVFPSDKADESWNVGITAIHGNEPLLIASAVGLETDQILTESGLQPTRAIVLPAIYGERTAKILREEFPNQAGKIFLSEELGEILKKTEFKSTYPEHLMQVAKHHSEVQDQVWRFLDSPFRARSLNGSYQEFQPSGRRLEINAGANVTAAGPDDPNTHFLFPNLLSDLVRAIQADPQIGHLYNNTVLSQVESIGAEIEGRYRSLQIPWADTFKTHPEFYSHDVTYIRTPPLKKPKYENVDRRSDKGAVYFMASGGGMGKSEADEEAARRVAEGYDVLRPEWLGLQFGRAALPDVIGHPYVVAVEGRAGMGIMWISQVAKKPFIALPFSITDNPEMKYNLEMLKETGLGVVTDARADIIERAMRLVPNIEEVNAHINSELKVPAGVDGIRFAAENIVRSELVRAGNQ